jgi:hypothetical protein
VFVSRAERTFGVKGWKLAVIPGLGKLVRTVPSFPRNYDPFKCNRVFPQLGHRFSTRGKLLTDLSLCWEEVFSLPPIMHSAITKRAIYLAGAKMAAMPTNLLQHINILFHNRCSFPLRLNFLNSISLKKTIVNFFNQERNSKLIRR